MIDLLGGRVVVKDGFLEQNVLRQLQAEVEKMNFHPVDEASAFNIWRRNAPLNPMTGVTVLWPESEEHREIAARLPQLAGSVYPSGSMVDKVMEAARQLAFNGPLDGLQGCVGVVATVFRYPPGTRLIWHTDEAYLGAFSAYISEPWNENWGGHFALEGEHGSSGVYSVVEPLANRIVVLSGGVRHSILPVSSDAALPRTAVSGFFVDQARAEGMIKKFVGDVADQGS